MKLLVAAQIEAFVAAAVLLLVALSLAQDVHLPAGGLLNNIPTAAPFPFYQNGAWRTPPGMAFFGAIMATSQLSSAYLTT